MKSGFKN